MSVIGSWEDVVLRDGSTLRLRPTTPADESLLVDFFEHLSEEALHLRFQGGVRVNPGLVQRFLTSDGHETLSLVGELPTKTARRARSRSAPTFGFATRRAPRSRSPLRTSFQREHREPAAGAARRAGADGGHQPVRRAGAAREHGDAARLRRHRLRGAAPSRRRRSSRSSSSSTTPAEVLDRIAQRDHSAVAASLTSFFRPRSVAVIGASARRGSIGGELFRNILAADFAGAAYPVNRSGDPVGGVPGYRSIARSPDRVDLAVICVPGAQVLDAAATPRCARAFARSASSRRASRRRASEGARARKPLLALVRAHGGAPGRSELPRRRVDGADA